MNERPQPVWQIPAAAIEAARHCPKGLACLADGPQCRVTAELAHANAVVVACCREIGPCPYKTGSYRYHGECQTVCSCPVRLAFWSEHSL